MIMRAASTCPASLIRAASVSPDLSLAASRVSETVSTAMRTGTNAMLSSIPGIADNRVRRRVDRRRPWRRWLHRRIVMWPLAGSGRVQTWRRLAHAAAVHPVIHQEPLHIGARFRDANAFDEEKRIILLAGARIDPAGQLHRTGIVGGGNLDEIAAIGIEQARDVTLAQRHIVGRVVQLRD